MKSNGPLTEQILLQLSEIRKVLNWQTVLLAAIAAFVGIRLVPS